MITTRQALSLSLTHRRKTLEPATVWRDLIKNSYTWYTLYCPSPRTGFRCAGRVIICPPLFCGRDASCLGRANVHSEIIAGLFHEAVKTKVEEKGAASACKSAGSDSASLRCPCLLSRKGLTPLFQGFFAKCPRRRRRWRSGLASGGDASDEDLSSARTSAYTTNFQDANQLRNTCRGRCSPSVSSFPRCFAAGP